MQTTEIESIQSSEVHNGRSQWYRFPSNKKKLLGVVDIAIILIMIIISKRIHVSTLIKF